MHCNCSCNCGQHLDYQFWRGSHHACTIKATESWAGPGSKATPCSLLLTITQHWLCGCTSNGKLSLGRRLTCGWPASYKSFWLLITFWAWSVITTVGTHGNDRPPLFPWFSGQKMLSLLLGMKLTACSHLPVHPETWHGPSYQGTFPALHSTVSPCVSSQGVEPACKELDLCPCSYKTPTCTW